ncbi:hypothetical protein ABBQ32_012294 [Trebouxia sp. C0010 RCD-2024]
MAKKKAGGKVSPVNSPAKTAEQGDVQAQLSNLRDEGNKHFGAKDYAKALESYDKALKLIPATHQDKPLLHSNKAACHMMAKKYKEATNECTAALEVAPGYHKALTRRAKAYENMGHYKQALSDVQKANKGPGATPETQEAEKRLKELLAGKRPAGNNTLATANGTTAAAKKQQARQQRAQPYVFQAKISLDDETRSMHMTGQVTYAELQHAVRDKFPTAGPLILKYLDKEGDLVTITDRNDLQVALKEVVESADKAAGQHGGPRLPNMIPPLRIHATRAKSEADVPPPPVDEENQFQQIIAARKYIAEQALKQQTKKDEPQEPQEQYAVDQWILDFANLFREQTGVDPDKHLDLQTLGWDKCTAAMEEAISSDKAEPIFKAAADKFQEVAATGMLQWGNVHLSMARKFLDDAAMKGTFKDLESRIKSEFDSAAAKYKEALGIKTDFYDGEMQLGQVDFERAKLAAGFLPEPVRVNPVDEEGKTRSPEKMTELVHEAHQAHTRKALKALKVDGLERSKALFAAAVKHYEDAILLLPAEERNKPIKQQIAGEPPAPDEDINFYAQSLVLIGNLLYEQSQITAAVDQDGWKDMVTKAAKLFKQAGCVSGDIKAALTSHIKHEEIDIPQDAEEPKKEAVKGLPSLAPKKKKAEGEATADKQAAAAE